MTVRRRDVLLTSAAAALLKAQTTLDVAYAGSMASVMEGPIKQAAAKELNIEMRGRAQGASALAQLIVGASIHPDVFISVTPSPMHLVLRAGKAQHSYPIARTEMVIAHSPAFKLQQDTWWSALEKPGVRFGRTDPVTDPQGRNIIFVMRLAEKFYNQPGLAERILGQDINTKQIFSEPSVQARLQSGQLDAASAYKIQPLAFNLPFVTLPPEINLGSTAHTSEYQQVSLTLNGKVHQPEPLVYYAASLTPSGQPFVEWLRGESAQAILSRSGYDAV